MIISASRRTDLPAFYSDWFLNRIKEGYCTVVNPFNWKQVKYVSLKPEDVDVIVFWTKYSKKIREKLDILDESGFKYYFQYTLTCYDKDIHNSLPEFQELTEEFIMLSSNIGPEKVIWRYDPVIISSVYNYDYHLKLFTETADKLKGKTNRVVISMVDYYKKTIKNMSDIIKSGNIINRHPEHNEKFGNFIRELYLAASKNNLEIYSCSETIDMAEYGIHPGKCIDDVYIKEIFGIEVDSKKDPGQRKECCCVKSVDIGIYNTCMHGCRYCYATNNHNIVIKNFKKHDPSSPSLIG